MDDQYQKHVDAALTSQKSYEGRAIYAQLAIAEAQMEIARAIVELAIAVRAATLTFDPDRGK